MGNYVEESLTKGETVRYAGRLSLWSYWINFLLGGFFALVLILTNLTWLYSLGTAALLVWPFLARRATELVVTDKRLIAKYGILSTHSIEMRFDKIETVRVKQDLIGRILNYGDIMVTGTGTTFDPIPNISKPIAFRNALNQAMDPSQPSTA